MGKCCNTLVNADLAWTASRMSQRAQRIHRIDGTSNKYRIINLTVAGTIEAGIMSLLSVRADLNDELFAEVGTKLLTVGSSHTKIKTGSKGSLMTKALGLYADEYRNSKLASENPKPVSKTTEDSSLKPKEETKPVNTSKNGVAEQLTLL